jgi:hypothetical protein
MGIGPCDCQIPGSGLKTCAAKAYVNRMLHCTPRASAGARDLGAVGGYRTRPASNQLLIERNLSNIYQSETFRQHSYVSLAATGVICGFDPRGPVTASGAPAAPLNDAR